MKIRLLFILFIFCGCRSASLEKQNEISDENLKIIPDSLFFRGSGFRYVIVDGDDWWISRMAVQDSIVFVNDEEREKQLMDNHWIKSCAWLRVERLNNRLIVSVDAKKRKTFEKESFSVDIQHADTVTSLTGTLGTVRSGFGEDISPSSCGIKFNREGGKVVIELKKGEVGLVTVDERNPQGWPSVRKELNDYTCDWLTVHCFPGKMLELKAAENPTLEARTFSLRLDYLNSSAYIEGIQQAAVDIPPTDTIGFASHKVYFPLEGGEIEVEALTDGWVLDNQSLGLNWLAIEIKGNRLKLTATPNFDYDIRRFVLRFKKGNYYEYLEGEQQRR